ncbi:MAG: flavin reductase family protein [Deltaproteobacteria bacterium]|jgi:flavin reductase (DIM6/NTAB) family NADH-FMN oxidoreductase RutF|nr:flavin reductase family protein [Deltaproteobacteria bacterium]
MPRKTDSPQTRTLTPFPLERAFTFVESGPLILVTTRHKRRKNVLALSWHMSLGLEPTIALTLGPWNYSFEAIVETGECVVAVPSVEMVKTAIAIGNCSGCDVDKFKTFGLSTQRASLVKAPLLADCYRNLECRVEHWIKKYSIFIVRGVKAWQNPNLLEARPIHSNGDGTFPIEGDAVNLRYLMTKWQDSI